jgi:MtN3 and saliva related transmembrane protein
MTLAFGYLIALAASVPDVLQLRRTLRRRHLSGLSALTQVSYLMSWSAWAVYGIRLGDGPVIVSSLLSVGVAATMVTLIARLGALPPLRHVLLPGFFYAAAATVALVDPRLGGTALALVEVTFFLPQLTATFRSADLSGVSPASIGWELTTSIGWVIYTVAAGIPEAGVFSGAYALLLAVVSWRLLRFHRGKPRPKRAR